MLVYVLGIDPNMLLLVWVRVDVLFDMGRVVVENVQ